MYKFFILCSILSSILYAEVFVSGQYRGRFDIYDGVNKLSYGDEAIDANSKVRGNSDDTIYLQQIIAGLTYIPDENWEMKAYMYDASSWGSSLKPDDFTKNSGTRDEYGMSFYDDHLELFETYVKRKNFFNKHLTFTLGRQQLGYGDKRIFGPGTWGNTMGWLWDAGHLSYRDGRNFIDLWYGQTRVKEPNDFSIVRKHRFQGEGIYSHFEFSTVKVEPFLAWRNTLFHDEVANENAYYYGARIYDNTAGFIYDATGVKSFGTYGTLDIDASAYAAKAGYQFDNVYKSRFTVGSIYASGDRNKNDSIKETFTAPFGANDGVHYGRMDVMVWTNMQDYQATFSFKPKKKLYVELAYHHFELAESSDKWYTFGYQNKAGNSYKEIGDEYDIILKYNVNTEIDIMAIGAYLNAGDFITKNDISQNDSSKIFLQFLYKFISK